MPAAGDIIELVHEQAYLGQGVNNVSYWQAQAAAASLVTLASWYETNVVPAFKSMQNDLLTHVNLRLRNLFIDAETYEEPLSGTGDLLNGSIEMPSFFALTFRLDHVQSDVRPGFKRLAGMVENHITDGVLPASVLTGLGTLASYFVQPPAVAVTDWVPVIVKRVCAEPNPDPDATPRCLRYRLPINQAELITGVPTSYEAYSQATTQNSRKWYT